MFTYYKINVTLEGNLLYFWPRIRLHAKFERSSSLIQLRSSLKLKVGVAGPGFHCAGLMCKVMSIPLSHCLYKIYAACYLGNPGGGGAVLGDCMWLQLPRKHMPSLLGMLSALPLWRPGWSGSSEEEEWGLPCTQTGWAMMWPEHTAFSDQGKALPVTAQLSAEPKLSNVRTLDGNPNHTNRERSETGDTEDI